MLPFIMAVGLRKLRSIDRKIWKNSKPSGGPQNLGYFFISPTYFFIFSTYFFIFSTYFFISPTYSYIFSTYLSFSTLGPWDLKKTPSLPAGRGGGGSQILGLVGIPKKSYETY